MVDSKRYPRTSLRSEKGMVLVVGLLFVAVLMILGTTAVLTSTTDLKISGNYKTASQAFYAAESGVEEARARMKGNFEPTASRIIDSDPTSTTWSVSIGGTGPYSSLQSAMSYTVRIQHQTSGGSVLYWGDANNDGMYERTTTPGANMRNIYLATSTGTSTGARKTTVVEMVKLPPITVPSPLYVEAITSIQGQSTHVIGTDQCGSADKPGISTTLGTGTISTGGGPEISGTGGSPSIAGGASNMDIQAMINAHKDSANYTYNITAATHTGMNWGTPTPGATQQSPSSCSVNNIVYYNTNDTDIKLAGGSQGCGLLLVEGDLELQGSFNWYGVVIVSGSVTLTGGGDKNITGGLLAGGSADANFVGGNANIIYCSSAVRDQTENQPLRRLTWKDPSM